MSDQSSLVIHADLHSFIKTNVHAAHNTHMLRSACKQTSKEMLHMFLPCIHMVIYTNNNWKHTHTLKNAENFLNKF